MMFDDVTQSAAGPRKDSALLFFGFLLRPSLGVVLGVDVVIGPWSCDEDDDGTVVVDDAEEDDEDIFPSFLRCDNVLASNTNNNNLVRSI